MAQTKPAVDLTAETSHHATLSNPYVRVFQVEVPPGASTLLHRHSHDYVLISIGKADLLNQVEGKPAAELKYQDGEAQFAANPVVHQVRNLGDTPFRNVTVELLPELLNPSYQWDEVRGLRILSGGTRDILFVKDGVRVSEVILQAGAIIPTHNHPGPHLMVALTAMTAHSEVPGKPAKVFNLKAGETAWLPGPITHSLMNMGKADARFISLEFPPH